MLTEQKNYSADKSELFGHFYYNPAAEKKPAIIIAHAWYGLDAFAKQKAEYLASLGYVAFAADVYGHNKLAKTDEEARALMGPLFLDRHVMQKRIIAAYDTVVQHAAVDATRIGIIGFCFGGLVAIELLRSGTPIKGAVSFHGVLANEKEGHRAKTVPIAKGIKGSLLMLHGHDDPLVSQQDILQIQTELTEAKVDWQMNIYGGTSHAFTNPEAHDIKNGLIYNKQTADRAWSAMRSFFSEIFA